jgi:hypothetical protein
MKSAGLVSNQDGCNDDLDALQAVHTALCYFCYINARADLVRDFLTAHPHGLLLEGTGIVVEESASYILQQQQQCCCCTNESACWKNRRKLVQLIARGPDYWLHCKEQQMQSSNSSCELNVSWSNVQEPMIALEKEISWLRLQETELSLMRLETAVRVRRCEDELRLAKNCGSYLVKQQQQKRIVCLMPNRKESARRRSKLECQMSAAMADLDWMDRNHAEILLRIRQGRRLQFQLLKKTFPCPRLGCARKSRKHVDISIEYGACIGMIVAAVVKKWR